jgi:hypothetical protein
LRKVKPSEKKNMAILLGSLDRLIAGVARLAGVRPFHVSAIETAEGRRRQ